MNCLNCGVDVPQTIGKRAKQFCTPKCRIEYWKKNKDLKKEIKPRKVKAAKSNFGVSNPVNDVSPQSVQLIHYEAKVAGLESELGNLRAENEGLKTALESLKKALDGKKVIEPVETSKNDYNPNENFRFKSKNGLK